MSPESDFGADYFRKYYLNPKTRVVTAAEMGARAALILAILRQAQIPVRRILDAGCGIGLLQRTAEWAPCGRRGPLKVGGQSIAGGPARRRTGGPNSPSKVRGP
jgi:hypothetical protein